MQTFFTIQALRAVAAILVVFTHSTLAIHERIDKQFALWEKGNFGVWLFFVISGFVMVVSTEKFKDLPGASIKFMKRRIERIVPVYWVATTLKVIIVCFLPGAALHAEADWGHIIASYLFIPWLNVDGVIGPIVYAGWTLNYEMFFYVIFTLALANIKRIQPLIFASVILGGFALLSLAVNPAWPLVLQYWCTHLVLLFLWGMIIAVVTLRGWRVNLITAIGLLLLGAVLFYIGSGPGFHDFLFIHVAPVAIIIASVSLEKQIGHRINKVLLFLGDASYSIYLFHTFAVPGFAAFLVKANLHLPLVVTLIFLITAGVMAGCFMYLIIEKPCLNWFRHRRSATKTNVV